MKMSGKHRANSVLTVETLSAHSILRKNWDSGFSVRALKGYEESLTRNVEVAISQVSKIGKNQNTVAIDEVVSRFGFDVMGEIGFNKSFGNLKNGKTAEAIKVSKFWKSERAQSRIRRLFSLTLPFPLTSLFRSSLKKQ